MELVLRDLDHPGPALGAVLDGFSRFLRENVDKFADDTTVRIHDIRVSTKKIRSLMRLGRGAIPETERTDATAILRGIKDIFSGTRDEEVMRQRLEEIYSGKKAARAREKLGIAAAAGEAAADTAAAAAKIDELTHLLAGLNLSELSSEHLCKNAAHFYRRARKLMKQCRECPEDVAMHDWRKRVKDVCYHAMALSELPQMGAYSKPLDELAESLGEYHDLALLGARAKGHKSIVADIAKKKRKVGKRCFQTAEKLFRTPPGKFVTKTIKALKKT